jgi:subtilisin family serine protease
VQEAAAVPRATLVRSAFLLTAQEAADAPPPLITPDKLKHVLVQLSPDLIPSGFSDLDWHPIVGGIYTVHVPVGQFEELAAQEQVKFIEIGRAMRPDLDTSVAETRADLVHAGTPDIPGLKGNGTIIGIIDYGSDFTLEDFVDANGKTRIAFLWDQQLTPQGGEASPQGFSYGVEYTGAQIDAARANPNPFAIVRHQPAEGSHGTHVAGTAAGNGKTHDGTYPAGRYIGTAPEARIILVQPGYDDPGMETFADSPRAADAIDYIFRKAKGTPCIVNMSLGPEWRQPRRRKHRRADDRSSAGGARTGLRRGGRQ